MIIISPIDRPVPIQFGYCHKQKALYLKNKKPLIHENNRRLTILEKMNVLKDMIKRKWK